MHIRLYSITYTYTYTYTYIHIHIHIHVFETFISYTYTYPSKYSTRFYNSLIVDVRKKAAAQWRGRLSVMHEIHERM